MGGYIGLINRGCGWINKGGRGPNLEMDGMIRVGEGVFGVGIVGVGIVGAARCSGILSRGALSTHTSVPQMVCNLESTLSATARFLKITNPLFPLGHTYVFRMPPNWLKCWTTSRWVWSGCRFIMNTLAPTS